MHFEAKPAVRLHIQDDGKKCGPACVQMIVASRLVNAQPQTALATQADIAASICSSSRLHSTPDGIAKALNHYLPSTEWVVVTCDTETELLADIAARLEQGWPAIVTDSGNDDHWCVIDRVAVLPTQVIVGLWDPNDPRGWDDGVGTEVKTHTYEDGCQAEPLVAESRTVGGTRTYFDTMMNNGRYQGKAVAIVQGKSAERVNDILRELKENRYERLAEVRGLPNPTN